MLRMLARAAGIACVLALLPATAGAQIRIGMAGPMAGQYAASGAEMRAGAEQAVADINAAGGVLGEPLVLEVSDDGCDTRQAVSIARNLVTRRVVFVAGHFCSTPSLAAAEVYAAAGVLQISPASTNPRLTDAGHWNTFRVSNRDDRQGEVAARLIAERFPGQRVALLHDGSAFGAGVAEAARRGLREAGQAEALHVAFSAGARDQSALVEQLARAGITVVHLAGYHTDAGLILRQMRERGLGAVAIGTDALAHPEFWQVTGAAGEGTLLTIAPDPRGRSEAAAVAARFRARGIEPAGHVLATYASVQVWAAAAQRAGSTEPRRVAEMLRSGGPWPSVLGPISFDAKGDVTVPTYVIHVWRNGRHGPM
jgi:branched-chain amino acid transport system substrate-binding protein